MSPFLWPFTPGKPSKPKARVQRCPTPVLPLTPAPKEPVAWLKVTMGFLHLSFPSLCTLPGHKGVFGTWETPPKLAPPAHCLGQCHLIPPQPSPLGCNPCTQPAQLLPSQPPSWQGQQT